MKRFNILFLLAFGFLLVTTTSCKKEGCTDPDAENFDADAQKDDGSCTYPITQQNLKMMLHSKWGMDDLALGQTVTMADGRSLKFSVTSVYLSNFMAEPDDNGSMIDFEDDYFLFKGGMATYDLGEVDPGMIHGVSFAVGIDSVTNHSDPSQYPSENVLSSANPDVQFWSWNSGYIFIKLEGMVDTTAAMTGTMDFPFELHIGTDNLYREIELSDHFTVTADQDYTLHVNLDFKQVLDGVDMRTDNVSHTMDNMPVAMTIANNIANAFTTH